MSKPTMKVTSDFTKEVNELIKSFKNEEILIGIPESTASRADAEKGEEPINNATLLAMNEHGMPAMNIPPRPVMAIGIARAAGAIENEFKKMAKDVLSGGLDALARGYERVGIIASTEVKKAINSQDGIDPPAPETLLARRAKGFKGTKALIVTGQLRNAITYVVRWRKK